MTLVPFAPVFAPTVALWRQARQGDVYSVQVVIGGPETTGLPGGSKELVDG